MKKKSTLINKNRSLIKVLEPFEDVSISSTSNDEIMIYYVWANKRSSKPVMKGCRVETVENVEKYKNLLEEYSKKQIYIGIILKDKRLFPNA